MTAELEPVAWAHEWGAIWRADNYPAGMDFTAPGWSPLVTLSSAQEAIDKREERIRELETRLKEVAGPCSLGVGCEQYGVCYADANGQPDQCGKPSYECEALRDARRIADHDKKLWLAAEARVKELEARPKLYCSMLATGVCDQIDRASALQALLDEVGEVLAPFARYRTADGIMGMDGRTHFRVPDGHMLLGNMNNAGDLASVDPETVVTVGDFRAARSLAAKIKEAKW